MLTASLRGLELPSKRVAQKQAAHDKLGSGDEDEGGNIMASHMEGVEQRGNHASVCDLTRDILYMHLQWGGMFNIQMT